MRHRFSLISAAALLAYAALSGCGTYNEAIIGPAWTGPRVNTGSQMNYPYGALTANVSGVALVTCIVTETLETRSCRAARESPVGWGFGDAAVRMHENVAVPPGTRPGPAFFTVPFCNSPESCEAQRAVSAGWRREMQARRAGAH